MTKSFLENYLIKSKDGVIFSEFGKLNEILKKYDSVIKFLMCLKFNLHEFFLPIFNLPLFHYPFTLL